jgi:predicted dehydrogenase
MTTKRPVRFGLVGTGHWARITHAPALASTPGIEFTAIWGRNPEALSALAAEHGVTAFSDIDEFLEAVDAVDFSVPPDVQSAIAVRAANAGKHLLLEKPIATSEAAAERLADAVRDARVASVVFFTARFQPEIMQWLDDVAAQGGWAGGNALWLGSGMLDGNPFNTPWRRDKGGLWDLGPHVVSLLWAALGPVVHVSADAGEADLVHLVLHHEGGASSTVTVTIGASDAAAGFELFIWGDSGRSVAPTDDVQPRAALRFALTELAENARSGQVSHRCDVHFGHQIARLLAQAQQQIVVRAGS